MTNTNTNSENLPNRPKMVQVERSMFGTRAPRPEGAGKHIVVIVAVILIGLVVALLIPTPGTDKTKATQERGPVEATQASN